MTARDRLVVVSIVALVVLGVGWVKFVSPKRSEVAKLQTKVEGAHQQVQSAQSELSQARYAQARYSEAYSSVVSLGRAVPAEQEVPGLLYELDQASDSKHVEFASLTPGTAATTAGPASKSGKEKSQAAGFQTMPFSFTFNGSFAQLYHLVTTIQGYAVTTPTGEVKVSGRLLTIQGFTLEPNQSVLTASSNTAAAGHKSAVSSPGEHLTGTVSATAYVLPVGTQLAGEATSAGPTASSGAQPASGSGSSSSTAPATIKAAP
jgi:Tfp pilus assembly protein PilO